MFDSCINKNALLCRKKKFISAQSSNIHECVQRSPDTVSIQFMAGGRPGVGRILMWKQNVSDDCNESPCFDKKHPHQEPSTIFKPYFLNFCLIQCVFHTPLNNENHSQCLKFIDFTSSEVKGNNVQLNN